MNSTVALVNVPEIPATHISINPDYSQQITRLEATLSGCPAIVTTEAYREYKAGALAAENLMGWLDR
jgi:hypothetical protein